MSCTFFNSVVTIQVLIPTLTPTLSLKGEGFRFPPPVRGRVREGVGLPTQLHSVYKVPRTIDETKS